MNASLAKSTKPRRPSSPQETAATGASKKTATKPPRQERSRKTRDQLLDAAERLLRSKPWEEISILEIMREAGCSNGAIYGRFKGKDELLIALYQRHDEQLKARFQRQRKNKPRPGETVEQFLGREIDQLVKSLTDNRWLLRAVGLLSRTRPDVVSAEVRHERKAIFDDVVGRVMHFESEIAHPNPRRAIQLAVFFVATIIREAVLYQGPHFGTLELSTRELKSSLKQMAIGFLGMHGVAIEKQGKTRARKR